MNSSTLVWVIIVILILGAGIWFFAVSPPTADVPTPTIVDSDTTVSTTPPTPGTTTSNTSTSGSLAPTSATVLYTTQGFTPKSVTVARGGTVTFVNQGGQQMWVAVDEHPTHALYDGTSRQEHCASDSSAVFDQCEAGNTYSFTFDKTGMWEFHNHMRAGDTGTVIVQ